MNELKKYWKEILFVVLALLAYYKIKTFYNSQQRKKADAITREELSNDSANAAQNLNEIAVSMYYAIYPQEFFGNSDEAAIIALCNLVGRENWAAFKQAYATTNAGIWGDRNLMQDLSTCLDAEDRAQIRFTLF